jgi:hypothetical protein
MVSPNPNSGEFDVPFYLEKEKLATLKVSDIIGKTWLEQVVKGKGNHSDKIKMTNFSPGMFLIHLRKANDIQVKKIVLMR